MPANNGLNWIWRWGMVGGLGVMSWVGVEVRGEAPSAAPPPASPEQVQRGRGLYMKHCASCHGRTGAGDGSAGSDLDPRPSDLREAEVAGKSEQRLFRQITRGRAPMPSFGKLMNDDDRWAVVGYVKTLGKPGGK